MKTVIVLNKATGKVVRSFPTLAGAKRFCKKLNTLCKCRRFTLKELLAT